MSHDLAARFEGDLGVALGSNADHETIAETFQRRTYRGRAYFHLVDARHGIDRGTAIIGETIVPGFPSIPRTLVVDPGISNVFDDTIYIEEKLNGYNVRIARADGELFAFTRSGYICPFTTSLIRTEPFETFLADFPDLTICGELIGMNNPYTPHEYEEVDGVGIRVFDFRENGNGTPLDPTQRYERCANYDLPEVPRFGTVEPEEAAERVTTLIDDLNEHGREGVMLKSSTGETQLKYTTSATHQADLAHAFSQPFDYGREFLFSRVIREAFQAAERGESEVERRERARALGEAILFPTIDAVESVEAGELIGDEHEIRGDPTAIESLIAQLLSQGLQLDIREDYYEDGERVVEFCKVARSSQDKIKHYLDGGLIDQ